MKHTKEVLILTQEDFIFLEKRLLEMGFAEITVGDSNKQFNRLDLFPPRPIVGRESSYRYTNNGYTVVIHTTYLKEEMKWRDIGTDTGWCIILEGDARKYTSRPFRRTKGFVLRLLRYAWISKWKVDHRPLCPACQAYMDIVCKKKTRQYFWICSRKKKHLEAQHFSWDHNLPPKAKKFVATRRDATATYKAVNKKLGKTPVPAAMKRKTWNIGNPQNKI